MFLIFLVVCVGEDLIYLEMEWIEVKKKKRNEKKRKYVKKEK